MASCIPIVLNIKFNRKQLDKFSDRIENVLEDMECRQVLKKFAEEADNKEYIKCISLWEEADYFLKLKNEPFDEDLLMELVDDIDSFNENGLYSASEPYEKLLFMRRETARILQVVHKPFVEYLIKKHSK